MVIPSGSTAPPARKRGRPKRKEEVPTEKILDRIAAAVRNKTGQPTVYASTTKGGMKLIYEGHHFRYSFRKGQYSIFQCCYKEAKSECKVKIVTDQKNAFPLEGEHCHFMPATDKSVTSQKFEPVAHQFESELEPQQNVEVDEMSIIEKVIESDQPEEGEEVKIQIENSDADALREKIKKRLQKALLGKKK